MFNAGFSVVAFVVDVTWLVSVENASVVNVVNPTSSSPATELGVPVTN